MYNVAAEHFILGVVYQPQKNSRYGRDHSCNPFSTYETVSCILLDFIFPMGEKKNREDFFSW